MSQYSPAGEKEYVRYFTTNDARLYIPLRNLEKVKYNLCGSFCLA